MNINQIEHLLWCYLKTPLKRNKTHKLPLLLNFARKLREQPDNSFLFSSDSEGAAHEAEAARNVTELKRHWDPPSPHPSPHTTSPCHENSNECLPATRINENFANLPFSIGSSPQQYQQLLPVDYCVPRNRERDRERELCSRTLDPRTPATDMYE